MSTWRPHLTDDSPKPGQPGNHDFEQWFRLRFGMSPEEAHQMREKARREEEAKRETNKPAR